MSISESANSCCTMPSSASGRRRPSGSAARSRAMSCARRATPEPAHAVRHPGGAEPHLRVPEALVHLAEHGVVGDHAALEDDLAVPAEQALVQGVDVPDDLHAGVVGVDEEHRRAAARRPGRRWCGPCRWRSRRRRAPLMNHLRPSIRQPPSILVAVVAQCRGSEPAPGAGSVIAKQDRISPAASGPDSAPSAPGGHHLEQVHVALVGRRAVQRERAQQRVAGRLEHHGLPAQVEPEAAPLGRRRAGRTPRPPGRPPAAARRVRARRGRTATASVPRVSPRRGRTRWCAVRWRRPCSSISKLMVISHP